MAALIVSCHWVMRNLLALILLPFTASAVDGEKVRVSVGMNHTNLVAIIEQHGAVDITLGMVVVGESPQPKTYWEFREYDAIVKLTTKQEKVTALTFWRKKDFDSQSARAKGGQIITVLELDTKTKKVRIEKKKGER